MSGTAMLALILVVTISCGSGGGGSGGPVGDRNKQVSAANDADKGAVCDWYAPMIGGYGTPRSCAYIPAAPDKSTCIAAFPSCAVTIGQYQDCLMDLAALQNNCSQMTLDQAWGQPECQAAGAAGCLD